MSWSIGSLVSNLRGGFAGLLDGLFLIYTSIKEGFRWIAERAISLILVFVAFLAYVVNVIWDLSNDQDLLGLATDFSVNPNLAIQDQMTEVPSWLQVFQFANYIIAFEHVVGALCAFLAFVIIINVYYFIKSWIPTVSGG